MEMLESFHLDGGKFHTSMVVARSGERMLGGKDDRGVIELKWMRLPRYVAMLQLLLRRPYEIHS